MTTLAEFLVDFTYIEESLKVFEKVALKQPLSWTEFALMGDNKQKFLDKFSYLPHHTNGTHVYVQPSEKEYYLNIKAAYNSYPSPSEELKARLLAELNRLIRE